MSNNEAKDVLTGSDAKVWLDGEEIGTWLHITLTVTKNYEDVQIGHDVDRKEVSQSGTGSVSAQATNSIGAKLFEKMQNAPDMRFVIETEMTKPSTNEVQFVSVNGVTFDDLPIADWGKGELYAPELSFKFPPSKMVITQTIE